MSGGTILALGEQETILSSEDGNTWTLRHSDPASSHAFAAAARSDRRWVAVAHYTQGLGDRDYVMATSDDGHAWQMLSASPFAPVGGLWDVIWSKQQFTAVGELGAVVTSPDGLAWTLRSTSENFVAAAWTGERFVAAAGRHVATSADGTTWEYSAAVDGLHDMVWVDNQLAGVSKGNAGDGWAVSRDGVAWSVAKGPPNSLALAKSASVWVAVGSGVAGVSIHHSSDGAMWDYVDTTTPGALFDVVWARDKFIAVGRPAGLIMTSPDGVAWTKQASPIVDDIEAVQWVESLGMAVAIGLQGEPITSQDGITWKVIDPKGQGSSDPFGDQTTGLVWEGKGLLAVGDALVTSPDASSWTRVTLDRQRRYRTGASGGGHTVVVGDHGKIAVRR
jgi:hypothetical protein